MSQPSSQSSGAETASIEDSAVESPVRSRPGPFKFTRLIDGQKRSSVDMAEVMDGEDLANQTWLFVAPHDDDLCIGSGLLIQAARKAGVDVHALVVTDGCMGYCSADQIDSIVETRRDETFESFELLGVDRDHVTYIDYPDSGLSKYLGRRPANNGERAIEGFVGLQNAFTYYLRKFRPTRVIVPTPTDLHPDHRITYSELMISLFHASGSIWPELGPPLFDVPKVYELAVYCDFAEPPNLQVAGDDEVFQTKLTALESFRSQEQIAALVNSVREAGSFEYFREVAFNLYSAQTYRSMFE